VRRRSARLGRCATAVAVALAVGWGPLAPAEAQNGAITTDVSVTVRQNGQTQARSALRVARTSAPQVSAVNNAYASARCHYCRAVAVSFQVVLANRGPGDVAADNAAVAINEGCVRCEAVAIAYQFVVVGPRRSHLTPVGQVRLARVRVELSDLSRSRAPAADLNARAEALAAEVADVLTTELWTVPRIDREVRRDR
jgi:hypothetical protein